jgi:hypothetical protein
VKVGDEILGYDEATATKKPAKVLALESPLRDNLCTLTFAHGKTLRLTSEHPVYTSNGWESLDPIALRREHETLAVGVLNIGDRVLFLDGDYQPLANVACESKLVQTYNLEQVEGVHTFFAGDVLVHNKGGDSSSSSSIFMCEEVTPIVGYGTTSGVSTSCPRIECYDHMPPPGCRIGPPTIVKGCPINCGVTICGSSTSGGSASEGTSTSSGHCPYFDCPAFILHEGCTRNPPTIVNGCPVNCGTETCSSTPVTSAPSSVSGATPSCLANGVRYDPNDPFVFCCKGLELSAACSNGGGALACDQFCQQPLGPLGSASSCLGRGQTYDSSIKLNKCCSGLGAFYDESTCHLDPRGSQYVAPICSNR